MQFKLEVFEGPLELLMYLLSKNKVSIYDIPIAEILDQYMAYLDDMKSFDLEIASEFVTIAAQLLLIKSKMLLPKYEDEPEEDPREQLVAMLLEYQRFKEMTDFMRMRSELGMDTYVKPPEDIEPDRSYIYIHAPRELERALYDMLKRGQRKLPPPASSFAGIVAREESPIAECAARIIEMLNTDRRVMIREIFCSARSRSELVGYFLAVLELCRSMRIYCDDVNGCISLAGDKPITDNNWFEDFGGIDEFEGSGINH